MLGAGDGTTRLSLRIFEKESESDGVVTLPHWEILNGDGHMVGAGPLATVELAISLLRLSQAATALLSTDQLRGWMRNHDLAGNVVRNDGKRIVIAR